MKAHCPYWSRARDRGQGTCALGRHGGRPWAGNCLACIERGENVPRRAPDWPLLLRPLKARAQPGDRGLGDIVARVVGPVGGNTFKAWHNRVLKRACGCEARQEALNAQFPL